MSGMIPGTVECRIWGCENCFVANARCLNSLNNMVVEEAVECYSCLCDLYFFFFLSWRKQKYDYEMLPKNMKAIAAAAAAILYE